MARQPDASKRALEHTLRLFATVDDGVEDGQVVGQHSVNDPDLLAIYQATCDVYMGGADSVIATLEPRMADIVRGSRRSYAITAAKLAQAYARAGEPSIACTLIVDTLDTAAAVESLTTRSELHLALPTLLARWPDRGDVREVQDLLDHLRRMSM